MRISATIGDTIGLTDDTARPGLAKGDGAYLNQLEYLTKILRDAGFPENGMAYFLAQIMHETGNLTSNLAHNYNNFSGIKYVHQPAASGSHNKFAIYASPGDWANDYHRVLSLKHRPIDASSAQDFYTRLMDNGYFTKAEAPAYATDFNARLKKIAQVLRDAGALGKEYANGNMNTYTTGSGLKKSDVKAANTAFDADREITKLENWASDHKTLAIGLGIAALILIATRK